MNNEDAQIDASQVIIESFLAGPQAEEPAVKVTWPGQAEHRMSAATAFGLASRLILAAKYAIGGIECGHPQTPEGAAWLAAVLELGEAALVEVGNKVKATIHDPPPDTNV